jgi:hypothetical protein
MLSNVLRCRGSQEDDMADILKFARRDTGKRRQGRGYGSADVIIFPGVRIEREEFSLADRVGTKLVRHAKAAAALEE